jgi:hypothetical protein
VPLDTQSTGSAAVAFSRGPPVLMEITVNIANFHGFLKTSNIKIAYYVICCIFVGCSTVHQQLVSSAPGIDEKTYLTGIWLGHRLIGNLTVQVQAKRNNSIVQCN